MTISRGLSAFMGYTTAAATPSALDSMGAANTRTETTSPIIQARRPNSVSSPPHSIVPPAIAIQMRPMAYATGPVSDVAIVRIGVSHGNAPPAAAWRRKLKKGSQGECPGESVRPAVYTFSLNTGHEII